MSSQVSYGTMVVLDKIELLSSPLSQSEQVELTKRLAQLSKLPLGTAHEQCSEFTVRVGTTSIVDLITDHNGLWKINHIVAHSRFTDTLPPAEYKLTVTASSTNARQGTIDIATAIDGSGRLVLRKN
jgi:hypothetical protein